MDIKGLDLETRNLILLVLDDGRSIKQKSYYFVSEFPLNRYWRRELDDVYQIIMRSDKE